jgi:plastocyanin
MVALAWLTASLLLLAACAPAATPTPEPAATPAETPAPPDDGEPEPGEETVNLTGFAFSPTELTVSVGTTVTFVNDDAAAHTVTHGSDGSATEGAAFDEDLPGGESTEITFQDAGTFEVTCRFHPTMNMTITVEG